MGLHINSAMLNPASVGNLARLFYWIRRVELNTVVVQVEHRRRFSSALNRMYLKELNNKFIMRKESAGVVGVYKMVLNNITEIL